MTLCGRVTRLRQLLHLRFVIYVSNDDSHEDTCISIKKIMDTSITVRKLIMDNCNNKLGNKLGKFNLTKFVTLTNEDEVYIIFLK